MLDTDGERIVSFLIEGPAATSIDRFTGIDAETQSEWLQDYFDLHEQWLDIIIAGITGTYQIATYETGMRRSWRWKLNRNSATWGTISWRRRIRMTMR